MTGKPDDKPTEGLTEEIEKIIAEEGTTSAWEISTAKRLRRFYTRIEAIVRKDEVENRRAFGINIEAAIRKDERERAAMIAIKEDRGCFECGEASKDIADAILRGDEEEPRTYKSDYKGDLGD